MNEFEYKIVGLRFTRGKENLHVCHLIHTKVKIKQKSKEYL